MTRPTTTKSPANSQVDLDIWMNGDPPLDSHSTRLLMTYREALSRANARENTDGEKHALATGNVPRDETQSIAAEDVASDGHGSSTNEEIASITRGAIGAPPRVTSVPRVAEAEGIAPERLSRLHGRLIAMGYLAEELPGRGGGIAYRLTRDGVRRLNQEEGVLEVA